MQYEHQDTDALAAERGCYVVYPAKDELQIDIDSEEAWIAHRELLNLYESRFFRIRSCTVTISKSGLPHRHVTIILSNEVTDIERIALQAALGSDRKRELLSLSRISQGEQRVTRFFEPKQSTQGDTI